MKKMNVLQAPFVEEMVKTTKNLYRLGWDERNGGNISYLLKEEEILPFLNPTQVLRKIPMKFDATKLAGKYFIVTGSGKYFKNVCDAPSENLGILRVSENGQELELLWGLAGVAWGTITEDSLSEQYTGFLGNTGPFARQKISSASLYDLASLTKVIGTTNRMLQLIDTNQLTFSTTVGEILPDYQGLSCSIGELLLHQSGLPADVVDKKNVTKKSLQEIILTHSLSERGQTTYSDLGYYLLGEIIQVLDRCSLEESFQTYVFQPMNLQHTSFTVSDFAQAVPTEITKQRGVIQGVVHDSKAYQLKAPIGSAGLFATLPDLLTFVQCFMNNRYPSGKPLFSEKMFDALWSMNQGGRTFGWEVKKTQAGAGYLYHTGFTGTAIGMKKETKEALILLTNRIHPTREERGFLKARTKIYQQYF